MINEAEKDMSMMDENVLIQKHVKKIDNAAKEFDRDITIMEICGGHTNVIMKYGIRDMLPENIRLISGPGCPVCVTSQYDIDCMIELARIGIPVATYGDMLKVPGSSHTLEDARAKGAKIFDVYSTTDVLKLKKTYPDIVFFGIGFETTAPMTAHLLKNNTCVYSVHKLIPPALKALMHDQANIDGFIDPGHVSTIIGAKAYTGIKVAQAISGFTPDQILRSISVLLELIRDGKKSTINCYPESVSDKGNIIAQKLIEKYFYVSDSEWRGLGIIPSSGLEVKNDELNAKLKHKNILAQVPTPKKTACRCGEILKGLIEPDDCPLYRKICTPANPKGACMVSAEGSCAISFRYGRQSL